MSPIKEHQNAIGYFILVIAKLPFKAKILGSLRDCNALLNNSSQVEGDGYLLIRGLINRDTVIKVRKAILRLIKMAISFKPNTDGWTRFTILMVDRLVQWAKNRSRIIQMFWEF